jgi:aspartate aminotransferase-like enzyme
MTSRLKLFVFPGNIEPHILDIASRQIPYMRTDSFSRLILESEEILLDLLDCQSGKLIPYTGSGTAAMDSCVLSYVSGRKRVLVINGGSFGARWAAICRYYHIPFDEIEVTFGNDPDWALIERALSSGAFDTILMQHHETSSGYLYDLERFSRLCAQSNVSMVVDAISSFLTDDFSMAELGIDVAILSSQKGLNLPPGLSFVALSKDVVERGGFYRKSFYLDWNEQLINLERGQTPYSPATQLFLQLSERLKSIKISGVNRSIQTSFKRASFFRDLCLSKHWVFSASRMSNCLTGVYLPYAVRPLVDHLQKLQIYVMPSAAENMIRVAHTGTLGEQDYLELTEEISKWEAINQK